MLEQVGASTQHMNIEQARKHFSWQFFYILFIVLHICYKYLWNNNDILIGNGENDIIE